jgi:hypothetical protein
MERRVEVKYGHEIRKYYSDHDAHIIFRHGVVGSLAIHSQIEKLFIGMPARS